MRRIAFDRIAAAALAAADRIAPALLPDGRRRGNEWLARNPRRADRHVGSFSVSLVSGKWADFASGDKGGDLVALAAFVAGVDQGEAARQLARALDLDPYEGI
jgi:hypothetical protein